MIPERTDDLPPAIAFSRLTRRENPEAVRACSIDTVMFNVGLRCDRTCAFCHHACSPTRTEAMSAATLMEALELLGTVRPRLLDLTGGEPALWPLLREAVSAARELGVERIRVRTDLTGLLATEADGLIGFLADQRVEVLASLQSPELAADGRLTALMALRDAGYGDGSAATVPLDLARTALATDTTSPGRYTESAYREALGVHGVEFRTLLEITGVPVGGLAATLARNPGALEAYRAELCARFNPAVLPLLACRTGIEVAWDGTLWDCDFNLAARVAVAHVPRDVAAVLADPGALDALATRDIAFGPHCFACAAGAGSG